jgi:hypothetical protein
MEDLQLDFEEENGDIKEYECQSPFDYRTE